METIIIPSFVDYFIKDWRLSEYSASEIMQICLSPRQMTIQYELNEMKAKVEDWLEEDETRLILLSQAIIHGNYEVEENIG